jgi:hypothetical protein
VTHIAAEVGLHRSTLHRSKAFVDARSAAMRAGGAWIPRGRKDSRTGAVEANDDEVE